MANRIDGTTPPPTTIQEPQEYVYVFPYPIFEKAVQPAAATRPLTEVTPLTNSPLEQGVLWLNGNTYKGEHFNGLPEGRGVLLYHTGITYDGEFHKGKYHGNGTLTLPDEGQYVGEFKDGLYDGFGVFTYLSGDVYTGNFIAGFRESGFLQYIAGGSYAGEYQNNKRHGQGILKSPNGETYMGAFKNGVYDGYGEVTFTDGSPPITGWFSNGLFVSKF